MKLLCGDEEMKPILSLNQSGINNEEKENLLVIIFSPLSQDLLVDVFINYH